MTDNKEQDGALDLVRKVYEEKSATINGREYKITSMTHDRRRKIFAFFSAVQSDIQKGDFSFLDSEKFKEVEKNIESVVLFDGNLLKNIVPDHWEKYPGDYMLLIQTMLAVASYPFLSAGNGS
jgi:hypothetical protein